MKNKDHSIKMTNTLTIILLLTTKQLKLQLKNGLIMIKKMVIQMLLMLKSLYS